ncbi:MAG: hypothetical protein ACOX50_01455 [Patescibacteria group bacterium]|jgi:hypothetical protein
MPEQDIELLPSPFPFKNVESVEKLVQRLMKENYNLIGQKKEADFKVEVYLAKDNPETITEETLSQIQSDVIEGLRLAKAVDTRCPRDYFLKIHKKYHAFASVEGRVGWKFVQSNPAARSAAILHETLHELQEDYFFCWDNNTEAIPVFAEFLFTQGEGRMRFFAKSYCDFCNQENTSPYSLAWGSIRPLLHDSDEGTPKDRFMALVAQRDSMTEEEKIALIKQSIEIAEKQESEQTPQTTIQP